MPIDHYKILLSINNLKVYYPITKGLFLKKIGDIKAVDDISFEDEPNFIIKNSPKLPHINRSLIIPETNYSMKVSRNQLME